nr:PocR ligand-binding domain-containing protein [uncultured Acetatifactor sp.]
MVSSFNLEKLTSMLRDFYTVTKIRITVFNENFREIAAFPKEIAPFCRLIRTDAAAASMCAACDREACRTAAKRHGMYIYQCHAGLKEAIMPIYLGNLAIGYLFFGHVFAYNSYEEGWKVIEQKCAGYQVRISELKAASLKHPLMSEAYILSAANLMQAIASYLCMERLATLRREDLPVQIDRYIQEHLTEDMDVKDICAHFQIGKTRLYEIARESYGMGIAEFIRRQRIEMAQELLRDFPELSISDVASRCGFQDYNYFFTVFRNIVGKSPKEYSNEE